MKLVFLGLLVYFAAIVAAKTNTHKALTESLGQEVIELSSPVKEAPAELDEEPAAENDDDEPVTVTSTTTTIQPATKNRKTTIIETRRRQKDKVDDEEAKIAKELAEIYKDNAEYKDDKSEEVSTTEVVTSSKSKEDVSNDAQRTGKPAERQRADSFKFQPNDINDKKEVERFRTSVDDISCDRSNAKLADEEKPVPKSAYTVLSNIFLLAAIKVFAFMSA